MVNGSVALERNDIDSVVWRRLDSKVYSVKSMYEWQESWDGAEVGIMKLVWGNVAPPKVKCFGWLVALGKIKSVELLWKLGIIQNLEHVICCFCGESFETNDHFLLTCWWVWRVWAGCFKWWGLMWVSPCSILDLLHWWNDMEFGKRVSPIWKLIPMAMLWSTWKWRNELRFENKKPDWDLAIEMVVVRVANWAKVIPHLNHFNVNDFLYNLGSVLVG